MSLTFSPLTLARACTAATDFVGGNPGWSGKTDAHHYWLRYLPNYAAIPAGLVPELEGRASTDIAAINNWLRERGFTIQLPLTSDPLAFGVAAISDLTVQWSRPGTAQSYYGHAGFHLDGGVQSFDSAAAPYPILQIATASGDVVTIHEQGRDPVGWKGLLEAVALTQTLVSTAEKPTETALLAPMVHLDQTPDVSWLRGLRTADFYVAQAVMQTRFGMNQLGARAMEATGMIMMRGIRQHLSQYTVTRPFLIYITRPGVPVPIFQAYITPEDWRDPGDLASL